MVEKNVEEMSILLSYGNFSFVKLRSFEKQSATIRFRMAVLHFTGKGWWGSTSVSRDVFAVTVQKRQKWKTKKALQSFLSCSLASNHVFFSTQMFSPQTHKAAWLISRAAKTNFLRFFFNFSSVHQFLCEWDCKQCKHSCHFHENCICNIE